MDVTAETKAIEGAGHQVLDASRRLEFGGSKAISALGHLDDAVRQNGVSALPDGIGDLLDMVVAKHTITNELTAFLAAMAILAAEVYEVVDLHLTSALAPPGPSGTNGPQGATTAPPAGPSGPQHR